jgi:ribonuclease PH
VMTGAGKFVEIQATAEKTAFDDQQMADLLRIARQGIEALVRVQEQALTRTPPR